MTNYINFQLYMCILFAGNSKFHGFPLVIFVFFAVFIFNYKKIFMFDFLNVCVFTFSIFLLSLNLFKDVFYNDIFLSWPLFFYFSYISLKSLNLSKINLSFYFFIPLLIFISLSFMFGSYEGGRLSFVFGPNMLYRVFCVTLLFLVFLSKSKIKQIILYSSLALSINIIGSKGGLVILLLNLIRTKILLSFIVFLLFIVFFDYSNFRIFNFSNIETGHRLNFLLDTSWHNIFGNSYVGFLSFYNSSFQHPHNIILELFFYYGIFSIPLVLLLLISFFRVMFLNYINKYLIFALPFFVFFLGAMFSGDITDNYVVLSLSILLLRRNFVRKLYK